MIETPSSLTPKSALRFWIKRTRASSASEKSNLLLVAMGTSHSASIHAFSVGRSRCDRSMNCCICMSNSHRLTRAFRGRLPPGDEFLEFRIALLRQHQLEGNVLIALDAVRTRNAAPLQPENATGARPCRHRHRSRAARRGAADLGAEHRFR